MCVAKLAIALLLFAILGCSSHPRPEPCKVGAEACARLFPTPDPTATVESANHANDEEYAIYNTVLTAMRFEEARSLAAGNPPVKSLVIDDRTSLHESVSRHPEYRDHLEAQLAVSHELVERFRMINASPAQLDAHFAIPLEVRLMTGGERQQLFSEPREGWSRFYQRYPDAFGIVTLSRVGFDAGGNEALVYVICGRERLSGDGQYFFVKRENGAWKPAAALRDWIS